MDSEEIDKEIKKADQLLGDQLEKGSNAKADPFKKFNIKIEKPKSESIIQSSLLESISVENPDDKYYQIMHEKKLNRDLLHLEQEIYDAINYENVEKFLDMGGDEQVDL